MEKLELENLREQTVSLLNQIKSKDEYIAQLETIPLIAKYNAFLYDREKLQEEYEEKKEEYEDKFQQDCPHPFHYLMYSNYRFLTKTTTYVCKCLRCNKSLEYSDFRISNYRKNEQLIFSEGEDGNLESVETSYEILHREFLELEREGYSFEEIREILYSKYTEKNEDLARNLKMKYMPRQGK